MDYSRHHSVFIRDKHQFFEQHSTGISPDLTAIEQRAKIVDYRFLLENKQLIEVEFNELFAVLQKLSSENKEPFWLYCYYCAALLENYHKAYSQPQKVAEYEQIRQKIKDQLNNVKTKKEATDDFISSIYASLMDGFSSFINAPFHISKIRDYVAYANLCRVYWVFCRLTITQGLTVANSIGLIDKLDVLLGTHTDINKIIAAIQIPTRVLNYFSVGLFLMRFMIDGGLLLKHTLFPSELEQGDKCGCTITRLDNIPRVPTLNAYRNSYILVNGDDASEAGIYYVSREGVVKKLSLTVTLNRVLAEKMSRQKTTYLSHEELKNSITKETGHSPETTTSYDRFKSEFYKRHCNFANDLVWATVNFLTNYNQISNIPGPITGYITAVFLVFDVGMTLYKCNLAEQEFLTKRAQYIEERDDYNNPKKFKRLNEAQRRAHIEVIDKQLMELEINWQTKRATFHFVAAAAMLITLGFTASMVISSPIMVTASFFVCTLAIAMYLSAGVYSEYKEKELYLRDSTRKNILVAQKEYDIAKNDFIFALTKNAILPTVFITTFAICWPAALILTAVYLGSEVGNAFVKHTDNKAVKQLALTTLPAEDDETSQLQLS